MNNEELLQELAKFNGELSGKGRITLRASGTEPKIRVMVESKDKEENDRIAKVLVDMIEKIDSDN